MKTGILGGICVLMLAACASTPPVADDTPALAPTLTAQKCAQAAPTTGSSIKRHDCSATQGVQSVDAQELMDQRRLSTSGSVR